VNNPHDKLIKIVFFDRTEAEAYFKQNLPAKLVGQFDWDTLKLEGTQYIDEELKERMLESNFGHGCLHRQSLLELLN